ncbi:hypothetical protein IKE67_09280 [bacterium]|nr:hypothetical protein [bacterium]
MGYIHCCGALHHCRTFELKEDEQYKIKELNYLEECPICGHTILQLTKIDIFNQISVYRLNNKKAKKFFEKYSKDIVKEVDKPENFAFRTNGKFYLNYNEYGKKRKCYSNLSSMKLGLFENNS